MRGCWLGCIVILFFHGTAIGMSAFWRWGAGKLSAPAGMSSGLRPFSTKLPDAGRLVGPSHDELVKMRLQDLLREYHETLADNMLQGIEKLPVGASQQEREQAMHVAESQACCQLIAQAEELGIDGRRLSSFLKSRKPLVQALTDIDRATREQEQAFAEDIESACGGQ